MHNSTGTVHWSFNCFLGGEKAARGSSGLLVYPNGAVVPADEPAVAAVKAGFGAAHLFAEINGY